MSSSKRRWKVTIFGGSRFGRELVSVCSARVRSPSGLDEKRNGVKRREKKGRVRRGGRENRMNTHSGSMQDL